MLLALGVLGFINVASAQSQSDDGQEKKSFMDRVDDLGKTIISPFMPDDKAKQKDSAATAEQRPATRPRPVIRAFRRPTVGERAASFPDICRVGPPRRTRRPPRFRVPRLTTCPRRSRALLTERHKRSSGRRLTNRKSATPICPKSRCGECPPAPCRQAPTGSPESVRDTTAPGSDRAGRIGGRCQREAGRRGGREGGREESRAAQPLHQRMSLLRKSPFDDDTAAESVSQPETPAADGHRRRRQRSRPPRRASRKPKCRHRRGEPDDGRAK